MRLPYGLVVSVPFVSSGYFASSANRNRQWRASFREHWEGEDRYFTAARPKHLNRRKLTEAEDLISQTAEVSVLFAPWIRHDYIQGLMKSWPSASPIRNTYMNTSKPCSYESLPSIGCLRGSTFRITSRFLQYKRTDQTYKSRALSNPYNGSISWFLHPLKHEWDRREEKRKDERTEDRREGKRQKRTEKIDDKRKEIREEKVGGE
jgi:hypothetical protein